MASVFTFFSFSRALGFFCVSICFENDLLPSPLIINLSIINHFKQSQLILIQIPLQLPLKFVGLKLFIYNIIFIIMMNVLQSQQQLHDAIGRNEDSVLSALRIFVDMLGNLSQLSDIIYTPNTTFPIDIYKTFRMLYENTESISNILQNYESQNQQFLQLKDELVAEQINRMQQIINREESEADNQYRYPTFSKRTNRYQPQRNEDQNTTISNLQREIGKLNDVLQRNNMQFEQEIKRYNNHLYELKENIQRYEMDLERVQELQVVIEEFEDKIVVLRQEKERDSLMIENMARKIRYYEKQIGGRQAFLSPRASDSQSRNLFSPNSNKVLTQARTQLPSYRKYQ